MKIVTYNVNGLRQRISQFGSLQKLLDSFDADIICFQETKLRRQELASDLVMADGYESFFSCTRTNDRGRTGYSGVATFCHVRSAFSSCEVALPIAAEEGFTGILENSVAAGLEDFSKDDLLKVDSEGRCVITDHGHFVLFNVYGPRADSDDADRVHFKSFFFKIMQRRWESLLHCKRRIFVVGDLNIAPSAIDRCDAGPDFERNEFRRWFRSMLLESGGHFYDVFRRKHPDRRDAYTCWPSSTGAEQFNYGSRIDHILCAGPCLHQDHELECHNLLACHVSECDILTEYKRWKGGNVVRWKGGLNMKLEGSDHVPVYTCLERVDDIPQHNTPPLASRYLPMIIGQQQTLVSVLMKRKAAAQQVESQKVLYPVGITVMETCISTAKSKRPSDCIESSDGNESCPSSQESQVDKLIEWSKCLSDERVCSTSRTLGDKQISLTPGKETMRKARKTEQLSLRSFFQKSRKLKNGLDVPATDSKIINSDPKGLINQNTEPPTFDDDSGTVEQPQLNAAPSPPDLNAADSCPSQKEKNVAALLEWQRIQQMMQLSIPVCKGHKEPCVSRVVKKAGPTFGHRFYVCARAEGPSSNPEANCGFFRWASMKSQKK